MKEEKYKVGKIFKNTQGCDFKIIEILKNYSYRIKFLKYKGELIISENSMCSRKFKNPYIPSVFGIGYLGIGIYTTRINNKSMKKYTSWKHLMERSYDSKYHEKFPTYKNVKVCEIWHNYQNYAKWFDDNYINGYHLDKDLLQLDVKNKIYSPETCLFIPDFLNTFIIQDFSNSKSGYKGVTYDKSSGKWMVTIFDYDRKVNKNLGRYSDINDAIKVYKNARSGNAEKVKKRVRSLNYLPEEIIQLIK